MHKVKHSRGTPEQSRPGNKSRPAGLPCPVLQQPFKGQSDVEVLHRIATEPAASSRSVDSSILIAIAVAVQRALAKDPADRFASAAAFAMALQAASDTSATATPVALPDLVPAEAAAPAESQATASRHHRWWWAAGGGTELAALGGLALLRPGPANPPMAEPLAAVLVVPAASLPPGQLTSPSTGPSAGPPLAVPASVAQVPAGAMAEPGAGYAKAAQPRPAPKPGPLLPNDGAWHGQLACGPGTVFHIDLCTLDCTPRCAGKVTKAVYLDGPWQGFLRSASWFFRRASSAGLPDGGMAPALARAKARARAKPLKR